MSKAEIEALDRYLADIEVLVNQVKEASEDLIELVDKTQDSVARVARTKESRDAEQP